MGEHIIALDIDLGKITSVSTKYGVVCDRANLFDGGSGLEVPEAPDVVLIEVAGPVMHHEESHSHRRWMIFNAVSTGLMTAMAMEAGIEVRMCPSTAWTKGYKEHERHAIAGMKPLKYKKVKGKDVPIYEHAHDVRECMAMIDFYKKDPKPWMTLDKYLESLCTKKGKS